MKIRDFIEKAIEGGYNGTSLVKKGCWNGIKTWNHDVLTNEDQLHFMAMLLDPIAWQAVGKVSGWAKSKYRACEMKMPFYHKEMMRGTGAIVGESKDKKQWYVRWDHSKNGKPTKNGGARYPYPKENIVEKSAEMNWLMVWHRMVDHLVEGKTIEDYLKTL